MTRYPRTVLFRFLGAVAGAALWLGLIVLALANFDTPVGFPEELRATWPFWLVSLIATVIAVMLKRRLGPGPGWGAFALGIAAPFVGLFVNARSGSALWFWLIIAVVVLVPYPARTSVAEA